MSVVSQSAPSRPGKSIACPRLVCIVLGFLFVVDGILCAEPVARRVPAADALFQSDPRWLGGDAALSVPLGDGRILWLFGDSFLGDGSARTRDGAVMVRNSIAVQHGLDASRATVTFHWKRDDKGPSSFFPDQGETWYWPGHGIALDADRVVVFLTKVGYAPGTALGFEVLGHALAVLGNTASPAGDWSVRVFNGPLGGRFVPAAALMRDGGYLVGLAVAHDGGHDAALVRYTVKDLARGDATKAEWWNGSSWGADAAKAVVVIPDAGAEGSLHRDKRSGLYVHTATLGFGNTQIAVRTALQLTGPWSTPQAVFRPEESAQPNAFVYAAKAHPSLSADQTLLVTYVANSFDPARLFGEAGMRLYWPRFVAVSLNEILPPPTPQPAASAR